MLNDHRRRMIKRKYSAIGLKTLVALLFVCLNAPAILNAQKLIDSTKVNKHFLPKTDRQYRYTSGYIEDVPVPGYQWASDKAYEDFNDMKFGVRIHWGLYSIIQQEKESWPLLKKTNEEKQAYFDMYKTWNPRGFNADEWMNLFSESGMKMFAFTTKHHEGFSMFDTKTRVKKRVNYLAPGGPAIEDCDLAFSIMETPFKRDIVKELCDAAHKKNIKIDLYFSHPDWYDADFRPYVWHPLQVPSSGKLAVRNANLEPEGAIESHFGKNGPIMVADPSPEDVDRMMQHHRAQLKELLSNYGKIDMVCLDMWLGPSVWPQLRQTLLELRKIQPDVMLRARGIGNYGDYYTPEGFVPGDKENTQVPWFVIYPLGRTFSYESDPAQHKGAKWIIENLIDCAAKGGNFMIGVGPDGNGKFHPTAQAQLKQAGQWLKINGEGIYATRARAGDLWKEGDSIRFTRSKDNSVVYALSYNWPGSTFTLKSVKPKKGSAIYLLGGDTPLKWDYDTSHELVIHTPQNILDNIPEKLRLAYTFKIEQEAKESEGKQTIKR
jgi:alpha-L-fucosidase